MPSLKSLLPSIFTYCAVVGSPAVGSHTGCHVIPYMVRRFWRAKTSDSFGGRFGLSLSIDSHSDLLSEHFTSEVFLLSQSTI